MGDGTYGPCHEHTGLGSGLLPCAGCQTGYHTYSVIIDRRDPANEHIYWYLDGREFFSIREPQVSTQAWTQAIDDELLDHPRSRRHGRRVSRRARAADRRPMAQIIVGGHHERPLPGLYQR